MKKVITLVLALSFTLALFAGCYTTIEDPETALAAVPATGSTTAAVIPAAQKPSTLPVKAEAVTGVTVYSNTKAVVDASNSAEGYVMVKYTGGKKVSIKVTIALTNGTQYTYNLNNAGTYESFPISEGDGIYAVKVWEQVEGTKYAVAISSSVAVKLRNAFLPFLYANQYVNYASDSAAVKKAAELIKDCKTDLERLTAIYNFVIGELTYDKDLAAKIQNKQVVGYLPDVDKVLAAKKGICFDYAALMSAMLRSQNIPCKLVVGYAGTTYHAWINVYVEGIGWVDKAVYFDGTSWSMMDPTFMSSAKGAKNADEIKKYVGTGSNYSMKYVY